MLSVLLLVLSAILLPVSASSNWAMRAGRPRLLGVMVGPAHIVQALATIGRRTLVVRSISGAFLKPEACRKPFSLS